MPVKIDEDIPRTLFGEISEDTNRLPTLERESTASSESEISEGSSSSTESRQGSSTSGVFSEDSCGLADDEQSDTDGLVREDRLRDKFRRSLLDHLAGTKAHFKSQQQGEPELKFAQKRQIASDVLDHSAGQFLARFGRYLKENHLEYFQSMRVDYEVDYYLKQLQRYHCKATNRVDVKNRRFEALKELIGKGSYFSEEEMRKRNPLLYEHLVGQYLTDEEREQADKIDMSSFSNMLLDHIERDQICSLRRKQQEEEDNAFEEEEESDDEDDDDALEETNMDQDTEPEPLSSEERDLLKQEFVTSMYRSFLEGRDEDFDYTEVDFNTEYDCLDVRQQDEEEKYFDSETPEIVGEDGASCVDDDELDRYMNNLKEEKPMDTSST